MITNPIVKANSDAVGSDCSIEKLFEGHRISHHPTKHTITPYDSSDAGLTATAAADAVAAAHSEQAWHRVLRAPEARTVIRWQQYVLSMTF